MTHARKPDSTDYTARYLVVLNDGPTARALLFAQDERYLSEVIDDDGLVVDNLVRSGTACATPARLAQLEWMCAADALKCYALETKPQAE